MNLFFAILFGGWDFIKALWNCIVAFLDAFGTQLFQYIFEQWATSPYTIAGFIMAVFSGFGIWFGTKGGKRLHTIVSFVCETIGLVLMFAQ